MILSGTGVGGGSLVYANTLPVPKSDFFNRGSWKDLLDWETELVPYYKVAQEMLGVAENPKLEPVRYPSGSGFWRLLMAPMVTGKTLAGRIFRIIADLVVHPVANARVYLTGNWADRTQILFWAAPAWVNPGNTA